MANPAGADGRYRFADLTLDVGQRRVTRGDVPIRLGRLTFRLLLALVRAAPRVLTHDQLVEQVWDGRKTSPETVTQRVKLLRDALGDSAESPLYVGLVRNEGYHLIPPVDVLSGAAGATANPSATRVPRRWRGPVAALVALGVLVVGGYAVVDRIGGGGTPVTSAGPPKIVVLPFENLGSPDNEYFASGITEEIMSRLAQISGLRVISRQSATQYETAGKTLREIGAELGVAYVLEGTVRTDRTADGPGQVRVTPQLISVADDVHVWAARYTVSLVPGEIFGVQQEIADQVADAMDVTLLEADRQRLAEQPTGDQEAYDYYLRGHFFADRSSERSDLRIAVQMYERAVQLDPNFALAFAHLSAAHSEIWFEFIDRTPARLKLALEAVTEARRLDPDLPDAHRALGLYYYRRQDYKRARAQFAIAARGLPNSGSLLANMAFVERRQGNAAGALVMMERAAEIDTRSLALLEAIAETHTLLRNATEATAYFERAIVEAPNVADHYADMARFVALRLDASPERARTILDRAADAGLRDPQLVFASVEVDMAAGEYEAAVRRLAPVVSDILFQNQFIYVPTAHLYGQLYELLGDHERARSYYDSARVLLEARVRVDPADARLRSVLGMVYAAVGRPADAIREGRRGVELLPMSRDSWRGAFRVEHLARIYTMIGEHDQAIDELEMLLSVPSPVAVPMLRVDPAWDPLRDEPRFRALLAR